MAFNDQSQYPRGWVNPGATYPTTLTTGKTHVSGLFVSSIVAATTVTITNAAATRTIMVVAIPATAAVVNVPGFFSPDGVRVNSDQAAFTSVALFEYPQTS